MSRFFLTILCMLCFMWGETQARVGSPKQVHGITFEWGQVSVGLSLHKEPWKMPRTMPIRQFYRAIIRSADGKKRELQEEAAPILPSREADVQMIRYGVICAEFSEGRGDAQVQLGKNARVHLYSPRADEPITVRAHRMNIRLHTELADGQYYLCSTITPRKGKPRTVRSFLWKESEGVPARIVSIEPGVMQPGNKLYLTVQVGALRCILTEDGRLTECQPLAMPDR